ncbi:ABC transporter ATP-binding protein [Bradyrhizobium sp. ISRA464]|uniref:ABC transporter ATP-binding protein n=1 Tax=Bradyrhizobium sp. ISRA464 TaxID=2866200 RepID=UPI0024786A55|nr:ABC transporter ATP-binding protein [Bradyrhizobium sp. ISRA464]WGS31098.1 ABC transporter ATP-binding protein [Bradyrhizobium sp. ISRA464]
MTPLVSVRSVSKTYRRERSVVGALRDVSLEIGEGEFVRISGPSGSGKTTLLNLIARLDHPDQGHVIVAGTDLARLSGARASKYRAEQVGMVFQAYNLIPQLSALENVLLPMIALGRANQGRARELLDLVGLADRADHSPSQLSGGEQQRVAIARAFANDPALLLADEPTGNLDDQSAQRVMELLTSAVRQRGRTLLLVTHERDSVQTADKCLEMRAGVVTRAGGINLNSSDNLCSRI